MAVPAIFLLLCLLLRGAASQELLIAPRNPNALSPEVQVDFPTAGASPIAADDLPPTPAAAKPGVDTGPTELTTEPAKAPTPEAATPAIRSQTVVPDPTKAARPVPSREGINPARVTPSPRTAARVTPSRPPPPRTPTTPASGRAIPSAGSLKPTGSTPPPKIKSQSIDGPPTNETKRAPPNSPPPPEIRQQTAPSTPLLPSPSVNPPPAPGSTTFDREKSEPLPCCLWKRACENSAAKLTCNPVLYATCTNSSGTLPTEEACNACLTCRSQSLSLPPGELILGDNPPERPIDACFASTERSGDWIVCSRVSYTCHVYTDYYGNCPSHLVDLIQSYSRSLGDPDE